VVQDPINRAQRESNYPVALTDTTPDWIADTNWSRGSSHSWQVAIGGAMPNMPEQRCEERSGASALTTAAGNRPGVGLQVRSAHHETDHRPLRHESGIVVGENALARNYA
jgi:hypothetical protein